ncbi:hypothetical protein O3G_MSEX014748 [Manduca sexta]|uniref:Uncharacterized protein n=1 Tax=Manduca sexta TaxID=7130 RepID=A0A921ZWI5_MANSE|nr:hypothetical protein O3G_MSEX014748 [Manduca sexta]
MNVPHNPIYSIKYGDNFKIDVCKIQHIIIYTAPPRPLCFTGINSFGTPKDNELTPALKKNMKPTRKYTDIVELLDNIPTDCNNITTDAPNINKDEVTPVAKNTVLFLNNFKCSAVLKAPMYEKMWIEIIP